MVEKKKFLESLESLKIELLNMATQAMKNVADATKAAKKRDNDLAKAVIEKDNDIDRLEIKIEEECVRLLATQQPLASDLRMITAILKINSDLERISDHAVNIAESVEIISNRPQVKPLISIPMMAQIAQEMLSTTLDAFVQEKPELARQVCERDDEVDDLNDEVIRELVTYMMEDPRTISSALELINISKNLERVADLATNIAEDVVFIFQAKIIKHRLDEKNNEMPTV
jgi:phosphate transport system protein